VSTTTIVAFGTTLALLIGLSAVNRSKGPSESRRLGGQLYGLVGLISELIGAFRLAHPDSPWATRFYGPGKMRRARARYGEIALSDEPATFVDRQASWFDRRAGWTLAGNILMALLGVVMLLTAAAKPASYVDGTGDARDVITLAVGVLLVIVFSGRSFRSVRETLTR
jgi:hypothetical protein